MRVDFLVGVGVTGAALRFLALFVVGGGDVGFGGELGGGFGFGGDFGFGGGLRSSFLTQAGLFGQSLA